MAYEKRKSGVYYYQKKRVNGKVISIYLGKGPEAEAAHARIQKKNEAAGELEERAAAHAPLQRWFEDTEPLMDIWYLAHGFHYANGRWRKRNARTLTPEINAETERYQIVYQRLDAALRAQRLGEQRHQVQERSGNETNYGVTVSCSTPNGGTASQVMSEHPEPTKPRRRPRPTVRQSRRTASLIGLCTGIMPTETSGGEMGATVDL